MIVAGIHLAPYRLLRGRLYANKGQIGDVVRFTRGIVVPFEHGS
jgi:hypothetical protein